MSLGILYSRLLRMMAEMVLCRHLVLSHPHGRKRAVCTLGCRHVNSWQYLCHQRHLCWQWQLAVLLRCVSLFAPAAMHISHCLAARWCHCTACPAGLASCIGGSPWLSRSAGCCLWSCCGGAEFVNHINRETKFKYCYHYYVTEIVKKRVRSVILICNKVSNMRQDNTK